MSSSSSLFSQLIKRLLAGIAGGMVGTLSALLIFLLASFVHTEDIGVVQSYSIVAILAMVFVSTLASNLLVGLFLHLWEREKYVRLKAMLFQIFLFTIVLFVLSIPFYLLNFQDSLRTAGVHFLTSALICGLVCEIVSGWKNSLTGLLGIIFGGCFLYGIFTLLFLSFGNYPLLLIFFLPIAWVFILLSIFLVEVVHQVFFSAYGTTPLSPEEQIESPKSKV